MLKIIRVLIVVIGLSVTLIFFNNQIRAMEKIKQDGVTVLLKLRPVDPRAFMQGDYMTLAYSNDSFEEWSDETPKSGKAILKLDDNNVGKFLRIDDGSALAKDEVRINFVSKGHEMNYGGERYFFQEGMAEIYESAEYGVFKVAPSGRAILVALADENFITK